MTRGDSRDLTRTLLSAREIWQKYDPMERRLTRPLTDRMLDLAGLAPGMHVLDIGTGRGEPAIPAAQRIAPTGSVLGVNVSKDMLEMARERAYDEGVTNLILDVQSAESLSVPVQHFDAVLARWTLMYLQFPVAALTAAARALKPEGTLVAALWGEPERVDYFTLPRTLLARYVSLPEIDFEGPGTFRYANLDRIQRDFSEACFTVERIEEHHTPVMETTSDRELIDWARDFGMERLLQNLSPEIQAAWERDLAGEVRARSGGGVGPLRLGGVTKLVVARTARHGRIYSSESHHWARIPSS